MRIPTLDLPAHFRQTLEAKTSQAPAADRLPLWIQDQCVGSVSPLLLQTLESQGYPLNQFGLRREVSSRGLELQFTDGPTQVFHRLASVLRTLQMVPPMKEEALAIGGSPGHRLGLIPRDLVRLFGVASQSVHLVGISVDGRCWVQHRALSKAEDPGQWDTLVGGTVTFGESSASTLTREMWEEAGLRTPDLAWLRSAGRLTIQQPRPVKEWLGHQTEHIDCYVALLRPGVSPRNQDGEVLAFQPLDLEELSRWLQNEAFTLEAAATMLQVFKASNPPARTWPG